MNVIAVFKSRSETLRFAEALRNYGVWVTVVNTPKSVKAGCGLSAKFPETNINKARFILANGKYRSFVGFFGVNGSFDNPFYG